MSRPFSEKVALITGAASGIGRSAALAFAGMGAKVVVSDINEAGGNETVQLIEQMGGQSFFQKTDVSDLAQVEQLISEAVQKYGRLDFGINNAGIGGMWSRTVEYPAEDYRKVIAVNQDGVFYCMKYEIEQMLKQESGGAIINVSSIAGLRGLPNSSAYTASKHAVIGLTRSAAVEYARNQIRINAICPVFTRTPLFEKTFEVDPSYEEKLLRNIPMRRYGQPQDIAEAIIWLCSEQSSFVTGQAIALDGGLTAQ